jgi:hypothetical protein
VVVAAAVFVTLTVNAPVPVIVSLFAVTPGESSVPVPTPSAFFVPRVKTHAEVEVPAVQVFPPFSDPAIAVEVSNFTVATDPPFTPGKLPPGA